MEIPLEFECCALNGQNTFFHAPGTIHGADTRAGMRQDVSRQNAGEIVAIAILHLL